MNLFQLAFDHLQENGMSEEESDAMLLWWGSIGLGRLWSWEDEVQSLTGYQSDTLDTAAVAWINRGKPKVKPE